MEITDAEIQHLKEQNNRRVKRVVTAVALTLIVSLTTQQVVGA